MASSDSRFPGASLTLNGEPVAGLVDLEVSSNAYFAADRFRFRVALAASGYAPWSAQSLDVTITASVGGASASLVDGVIDHLRVDAARNEIVADGRDLTALFIDSQIQESFENQTASDIANTLASRHGLTTNAAPTQDLIGRDFQSDFVRALLAQHAHTMTEWDLLVKLAEREGYDVWVSGQTLNFQPPAADPSPIVLTPAQCVALHMERSVVLSAGIAVEVRSWDCRGSQIISQQSAASQGSSPTYVFTRPNLTAQAAQTLADRTAALIAMRGRVVSLDMPGELVAAPRRGLALGNTGTDFDGLYEIVSVERRISFAEGFSQSLEAVLPSWTSSSTP